MAITFDDATRNLATHAVPVLRELRLPAAMFLVTGPMGTGETLWPDRLWLAIARTAATEVDLAELDSARARSTVWSTAAKPTRPRSRG